MTLSHLQIAVRMKVDTPPVCPWKRPGKSPYIHGQHVNSPRQSPAETDHRHQIPLPDGFLLERFRQSDRNGSGGGVSVTIHEKKLFERISSLFRRAFDDARIGLVGDD